MNRLDVPLILALVAAIIATGSLALLIRYVLRQRAGNVEEALMVRQVVDRVVHLEERVERLEGVDQPQDPGRTPGE